MSETIEQPAAAGPVESQPATDAGSSPAAAAPAKAEPSSGLPDAPAIAPGFFAGLSDESLADAGARGRYQNFATQLQRNGFTPEAGGAFVGWLDDVRRGERPTSTEAKHPFSLGRTHIATEDLPYWHAFANRMHEAGATQAHIDQALQIYTRAEATAAKANAEAYRETERLDREEAQRARDWMRAEFGNEASSNLRLLREYVAGLPEDKRAALEAERNADGLAALNNPDRLRGLISAARASRDTNMSAAEERAEIERVMREDRGRYNKDAHMQARYRDLIRENAGEAAAPMPKGVSAIDREIAHLEGRMRTDRTAYFADEKAQARLRSLYAARGNG